VGIRGWDEQLLSRFSIHNGRDRSVKVGHEIKYSNSEWFRSIYKAGTLDSRRVKQQKQNNKNRLTSKSKSNHPTTMSRLMLAE